MNGPGPGLLVGRDEELAVLRAAAVAASEGRPSAVLVGGAAGVGKTRLVAALRETSALPAGSMVLGAQCVDLGDPGLPYLVVTDLLRGILESADDDPAVATALRRAAVLTDLLDPAATGPGRPDESRRPRVLDEAARLLADLGRVRGLVVVIVEDLQWVDDSSAAFVRFLLTRVTSERLLLVATVRTDGLSAHPRGRRLVGELGRLPSVRRLDLAPFGPWEVARYLALVGADGIDGRGERDGPARDVDDLAAELFRRTGGNPFFVATLAGDLARTGGLAAGVPPALADVLVGRLDAQPHPVRTVARCVAISAQPVSDRMLRRVAGLDEAVLDEALHHAVAEGLLVPDGDGYAFPHELLRAAVRDDLLPGERARLHAAPRSGAGGR